MRFPFSPATLIAVALFFEAHTTVHAGDINISPQSISVISGNFSADTGNGSALTDAIDRSGLLLAPTEFETADLSSVLHDTADVNEARLFPGPAATIRLDLGSPMSITRAYFWNNNSSGNNNVGTYVYTFRDGSLSLLGTSPTLNAANITTTTATSDVYSLPSTLANVRFVDVALTIRPGSGIDSFGVGEVAFSVPGPSIQIARDGQQLVIDFSGRLQTTTDFGEWIDLAPQPASPFFFSIDGPRRFFRTTSDAPE